MEECEPHNLSVLVDQFEPRVVHIAIETEQDQRILGHRHRESVRPRTDANTSLVHCANLNPGIESEDIPDRLVSLLQLRVDRRAFP